MSTRPPGFFSKVKRCLAAVFQRKPDSSKTVTFDMPLPGLAKARMSTTKRRSQYDILHAGRCISYAEHDAHVRAAMEFGIERPSWRVWHGMRLPHEENRHV